MRTTRAAELALLLSLAAPLAGGAWAADGAIYSCVDANGRKLTSDRPIAECAGREQKLHNADGSLRKVVPPTPTADERAETEAAERRVAAERAAMQEAVRSDRNLLLRYPNEAAHRRAREAALDDVRKAVRTSEDRLKTLAVERKPLLDETEFYTGRALPAKLKQALDANDAAVEAQRALVQNQQAEMTRINTVFDTELERLKRLWAGGAAQAGIGEVGFEAAAAGSAGPTRAARAGPDQLNRASSSAVR
jgi:Domain of unknown function (DUF4124)